MSLGLLGLERMGPLEILLIVVVLVLIFGAKRIPELARSLGKSINEFKKGQREGVSEKDTAQQDAKDDQGDESKKT